MPDFSKRAESDAEKARKKAKQEEQKQKQKQREKARKEKERAKLKEKARKSKEREKARKEKERAKEREKAKKAKEREKIAKQNERRIFKKKPASNKATPQTSVNELKDILKRLQRIVNHRVDILVNTAAEIGGAMPPALQRLLDSGGKISAAGNDKAFLYGEYLRAMEFLNDTTSTKQGYLDFLKKLYDKDEYEFVEDETENETGNENDKDEEFQERINMMWDIWNKLKEIYPWIEYDSDARMILENYCMNTDMTYDEIYDSMIEYCKDKMSESKQTYNSMKQFK